MKKVSAILVMFVLVAGTLFLPNYPALHYYFYQKLMISNADVSVENSHNLLSDYRYLSAISERASDVINAEKKAPASPPKPHKEFSSFVYLPGDTYLQLQVRAVPIRYIHFSEHWNGRSLPVNNPPPQV